MMDAERWLRLSPHLDALLELELIERDARLAEIRAEDPTLANDLSELDIHDPAAFRRPLLIILPDGKALRCAYDKRRLDQSVDIAPPGIGNVGIGYRIYLARRTEP